VNKQLTDIELIQKYHRNELDSRSMQQLEQRALDDPFLADALDGFQDHQLQATEIADLNKRLEQSIQKHQRKQKLFGGYASWAIAASVVVLIGLISIYLNQPAENTAIRMKDVPEITKVPQGEKDEENMLHEDASSTKDEDDYSIIEESPTVVTNVKKPAREISTQSLADAMLPEAVQKKDTLDLDEVIVVGYGTQKKADISGVVATLSGRAAGVAVQESESAALSKTASVAKVSGKIVDKNGLPLPGVQITNQQTKDVTISNAEGDFSIAATQGQTLNTSYLGFLNEEVKIANQNKLNVTLKEDEKSLSEVVVVGYGNKINKIAGPVKGWVDFRKYIKANNKLAGSRGAVAVQFTIMPNGELKDFNILKSLNKQADAKAIELIKNYSSWQGSSNGKPETFKVSIRFN
jgi:TonB family protein